MSNRRTVFRFFQFHADFSKKCKFPYSQFLTHAAKSRQCHEYERCHGIIRMSYLCFRTYMAKCGQRSKYPQSSLSIFSTGFPFAISSTSLSSIRMSRIFESSISSMRTPQIFLSRSSGQDSFAEHYQRNRHR